MWWPPDRRPNPPCLLQGHAGTVPMKLRKDPMAAAAEIIAHMETMCNGGAHEGPPARCAAVCKGGQWRPPRGPPACPPASQQVCAGAHAILSRWPSPLPFLPPLCVVDPSGRPLLSPAAPPWLPMSPLCALWAPWTCGPTQATSSRGERPAGRVVGHSKRESGPGALFAGSSTRVPPSWRAQVPCCCVQPRCSFLTPLSPPHPPHPLQQPQLHPGHPQPVGRQPQAG